MINLVLKQTPNLKCLGFTRYYMRFMPLASHITYCRFFIRIKRSKEKGFPEFCLFNGPGR